MVSQRIHYLDALRSFCMLYGVFFRAELVAPGILLYQMIADASGLFRMATFFAVSGFFAAMLLDRRGSGGFLNARLVAVGVPALVCMVILNPETAYLKYVFETGWVDLGTYAAAQFSAEAIGSYNWVLHLWFLFALLAYILVAPALVWAIRRGRAAEAYGWIDGRLGWAVFPLLAVAVGGALVFFRGLSAVALTPILHGSVSGVALLTMHHFPFFALGLLAYWSPRLFDRLHTVPLVTGALACGLWALVYATGAGEHGPAAMQILYFFTLGFTNVCMIGLLMWVFRRLVTGPSRVLSLISGSVYTVYLFHYLAVVGLAVALRPVIDNPHVLYALVVVLTFAVTIALHEWVIGRSPWLRFLFNGRPPMAAAAGAPRRAAVVPQSAE
jgi:glucan biosynthesis protein C